MEAEHSPIVSKIDTERLSSRSPIFRLRPYQPPEKDVIAELLFHLMERVALVGLVGYAAKITGSQVLKWFYTSSAVYLGFWVSAQIMALVECVVDIKGKANSPKFAVIFTVIWIVILTIGATWFVNHLITKAVTEIIRSEALKSGPAKAVPVATP